MKKKNVIKKMGCLAIAITTLFSLTACGKKSESSDVTKIVVATGQLFAPYCYTDDNGELTGYDVAVLKALDEIMPDYEFDIQGMGFDTCIVSLDSGAVDMVAFELGKNEEREEKYLFPETSYSLSPQNLVVKKDSGIESLADMAGKTIGISPSVYEYLLIQEYNEENPEMAINIQEISELTTADNYRNVSNGVYDAALTYAETYNNVASEIGIDNLMMTDPVLVQEEYFMINKDEVDFCNALNEAIITLKENGTLSKLAVEYLGEDLFEEYGDIADGKMH
jgi:L-cystine transport system substrate-binding protein